MTEQEVMEAVTFALKGGCVTSIAMEAQFAALAYLKDSDYHQYERILAEMIDNNQVEFYLSTHNQERVYSLTDWYERELDIEFGKKLERAVEALEALGLAGRVLADGNPLTLWQRDGTKHRRWYHRQLLERLSMVACDARKFAIDAK